MDNNLNLYKKGSEWRKWDLHLHTPSSYDYANKSVTDEQIVQTLKDNEIALVVICDHHILDVERYLKLVELGGDEVKFLPGIELTTDLCHHNIHIIAIFEETSDRTKLEHIWNTLNIKLNISKQKIEQNKQDNEIYVDFNVATEIIKTELGGLVSVHSGKKSNSVDKIKITLPHEEAIKDDIASRIDIFEIGQLSDIKIYNDRVFPTIGIKPMVRGSDNHNIEDYSLKFNCWIKADPNFEGLKRILTDPSVRVFCGDEPDKLKDIGLNKTHYINKIVLASDEPSEHWFKDEILLNPELISIIGNKGSGKSALADIIGLSGNSQNYVYFSFLKDAKFYKAQTSDKHYAQIYWENDLTNPKKVYLNEKNKSDAIEQVRYIPQNYFETICNLIDNQKGFKEEIEKVIFKHLTAEERQDADNFEELIKNKKELARKDLERLVSDLSTKVDDYANCENWLLSTNQKLTKSKLDELGNQKLALEAEILALTKAPPPEQIETSEKIKQIAENIKIKEQFILKLKEELNATMLKESLIIKLKEELEVFKRQYDTFTEDTTDIIQKLGISQSDIVELQFKTTIIDEKNNAILVQKADFVKKIQSEADVLKLLQEQQKQEEELLSGEAKKYQEYFNKKSELEKRKAEILGDESNPSATKNTYFYYKYLCSEQYTKSVRQQKEVLYEQIKQITHSIFTKYIEIRSVYEKLKNSVDEFIKKFDDQQKGNIKIDFKPIIKIKKDEFINRLMNDINKIGIFREPECSSFFKKLCDLSLNDANEFWQMCEVLIKNLKDPTGTENQDSTVLNALKKERVQNNIYKFIFSAEYLDVDYELEFNKKLIPMLSPGERGLLLLTFFLLADTSNLPLILDQPEENLDNQTIKNVLVPLINNAKRQRQVIVVTHNPNLAVVCDSEQIIYSSFNMDEKPKINYVTGSLENFRINEKTVDILEGTMEAFRIRDNKYIKQSNI